jgi:CubicO group peptidase (beta-lactamase class C family)
LRHQSLRFAALTAVVAFVALAAQAAAQQPALDSALRGLEAMGFNGVVRVEQGGKVLLEKGYGLANRGEKIPFSPSTVVQIGSNTKDLTVVALLQLHERGKLNIHDSLSKYFPTAPADKRNITLWQLVTHVAGFPIGFGGDFESVTRDQLVNAALARRLEFPPGTGERYSNTGYSLLAAIIEQVSGDTYDEYVRDNILDPLGLKNTGFLLPRFEASRLAHGYRSGEDVGTLLSKPHAADGPYWNLRGNGGMLSTVGDMHAFYKALFESSTLLTPATRALRFNPDEPIGLAGSDLVSSFLYDRLPGRGVEIIIATNSSEFRFPAVRAAIGAVLSLPSPHGGPVVDVAPRPTAKAPSTPVATLLTDFVSAINSGDGTKLTTFIAEHFIIEPGTPAAEQRAQRLVGMHQNLGELRVSGLDQRDDGSVEITVVSAKEGRATLKVSVDAGPPPRIKAMQVMVGG